MFSTSHFCHSMNWAHQTTSANDVMLTVFAQEKAEVQHCKLATRRAALTVC